MRWGSWGGRWEEKSGLLGMRVSSALVVGDTPEMSALFFF